MEVQRTCEVTATPVEYVKARCTCERAGRCQPERGADEYGNSGKLLDRAIRGFEDLLFSSPQLLRTFFLPCIWRTAGDVFADHKIQCPLWRVTGHNEEKQVNNTTEQKTKGEQMERRLFTSESVTEGHPDKMCDAISDAILDALMEQDPMSRVACETATTTGIVMVMGEITTKAYVDIQKIVRETVREIGYDRAKYGFDCDTCGVLTAIDEQSADIALGVDKALEAKRLVKSI